MCNLAEIRSIALACVAAAVLAAGARAPAQFLETDVRVIQTVRAVQQGEFFGFIANRTADLTLDSAPDFIVGAPYADAGAGRAYLVSGLTGAVVHTFFGDPNEYMGTAVNDAGDLNDDGVRDIIIAGNGQPFIGPTGFRGRVLAYSGADRQLLWARTGEAVNDFLGYTIAGLHDDADGDGYNDVLAGAIGQDGGALNAGAVYILSGLDGATIRRIDHPTAGARLGSCVASIGDMDGDGVRDVIGGAYRASGGRSYIFSSDTGAVLNVLAPDSAAPGNFGLYFSDSVGDTDGDLKDDVYMADFGDATAGAGAGRAYIHSGASGQVLRSWNGEAAGAGFGIGRASPDIDCDRGGDLFLCAYLSSAGAPSAGRGYVLSGANGRTVRTMTGVNAGAVLGYDAGVAGDVDLDGWVDYFITGAGDDAAAISRTDGVMYIVAGDPKRSSGDMNCDGYVNFGDVDRFVEALSYPDGAGWPHACLWTYGDCDDDGEVNFADIDPFVARIGTQCPGL